MKKLIFSLVFMFLGVFVFANEEPEKKENDKDNLSFTLTNSEVNRCEFRITETFSDGSTRTTYITVDNVADPENCGKYLKMILAAW